MLDLHAYVPLVVQRDLVGGGSARISRYPARRSHVRPQQVVSDQAAEGRQRREARRALHEADPRDHHGRSPGRGRHRCELPAADGRRQGPRQLDARRQHQARDRASLRRGSRRRAVRGDHLRGDRPGERGGDRRGDDGQPQSDRVGGAQHLHAPRRDALDGGLAVRSARRHQHPAQRTRPRRDHARRDRRRRGRCLGPMPARSS